MNYIPGNKFFYKETGQIVIFKQMGRGHEGALIPMFEVEPGLLISHVDYRKLFVPVEIPVDQSRYDFIPRGHLTLIRPKPSC